MYRYQWFFPPDIVEILQTTDISDISADSADILNLVPLSISHNMNSKMFINYIINWYHETCCSPIQQAYWFLVIIKQLFQEMVNINLLQ